MKKLKVKYLFEIGQRLNAVRTEAGLTASMMALKLGLHRKNYYKYERGMYFPCLETLHRLQSEWDISLDWLLFEKGPVHSKDKQFSVVKEQENTNLENKSPEVRQLLEALARDNILLHEMMLYFYKYQQNRPVQP